jgi:HTH-type transcriptional regulator/antitoxin HigA
MANINTEIQYEKALERVDELLRVVDNETNENDKNYIELDLLSDLVAEYEEKYFPVEKPTTDIILG